MSETAFIEAERVTTELAPTQAEVLAEHLQQMERAVKQFMAPGDVVELRALNIPNGKWNPKTASGFYDFDHVGQMCKDAFRLSKSGLEGAPAAGVYLTLSPVNRAIQARRSNRFETAASGTLATDVDIPRIRRLMIDADPVRPAGISASDDEKLEAFDLIHRVRDYLEENGWALPILADSGNGYHLYYKTDLAPEDSVLVKDALSAIADLFDNSKAAVDTSVFNPSRITKFPGTKSRKGDDVPERPHRIASFLEVPDELRTVTRDQIIAIATGWKAKQVRATPAPQRTPSTRRSGNSIIDRARNYVMQIPGAISGQGGHDATIKVAGHLVKGFGLSVTDAKPLIEEWNQTCVPPWSDHELQHKLQEAERYSGDVGYILKRDDGSLNNSTNRGNARTSLDPDEPRYEVDDPRRLANLFLNRRRTKDGVCRCVRWNAQFMEWDSIAYREVKDDEIKSDLFNEIQQEFEMIGREELERFEADKTKKNDAKPPTVRKVKRGLVADVFEHVGSMSIIPASVPQPSWLKGSPDGFDPRETIVTKSGIVSLKKLATGQADYVQPLTPNYFSTNCIPFHFDERATEPTQWLQFLNDLWPDDPDSIRCLQEWMGLFLVPDTRTQKILLVVGPRRSGKGTIGRVIRALIGEQNVAGPTLASIATNFGLWPLIGKQAAIIADARLSSQTDAAIVAERLLSISGEDGITIDRKNLPPITTTLPTRFVLMTNELPRLTDASNALVGRFVILRMVNSFYGQEDRGLTDRLMTELPSILMWAIRGWWRLMENGRFTIPDSSEDLLTQLEDSASPVGAFVRECCEVSVTNEVDKEELFKAWKEWCESEGRAHPGTAATFAVQLRAAVSSVSSKRAQLMGQRVNRFTGIKIKAF